MPSHRADGPSLRRPRPRRASRRGAHAAVRTQARRPFWTGRLPQAAVVGTLGLATIVAPLAGDVLPVGGHAAQARAQEAQVQDAQTTSETTRQADLDLVPDPEEQVEVPEAVEATGYRVPTAEELAAAREAAGRASRALERRTLEEQWVAAAVPGCDPAMIDVGAANGRLDTAHLCELWGTGHLLRADAAVALARLTFAFREHFGYDPVITDSYRSYAAQASVAARKPGLAARPGTSEHGWALAVDFAGGVEAADHHYAWLVENAPTYGWDNPAWARQGGSGPYEPWHFEYVAGQAGR